MNWDVVGAIGEVVGAFGVILSLLYLAAQIRSNTRATRRQNAHNHNAAGREMWSLISSSDEIASVWRRGLMEPERLSADERVRFAMLMLSGVSLAEEDFHARNEKELPDWVSGMLSVGFYEVTRTPGFDGWFANRQHWLSDDFRKKIEAEMRQTNQTNSFDAFYKSEDNS